jgi:hypothetical protein
MLDSGAFTWFNQRMKSHKGGKLNWDLYKTKEFWDYVDSYALFVKKWSYLFQGYVTVDAVRNPQISWKVTRYLEKEHGLNPIPVVHFGTSEKWLQKYLDAGHKYIGFGGQIERQPYHPWADKMWNVVCNTPDRLPQIKVHGFAQTKIQTMARYPWYSVDSVTWKKMGYYGQVVVPQKINGNFSWQARFISVFTDLISPYTKRSGNGGGRHFLHLSRREQRTVREWLDHIGIEFGTQKKDGTIIQLGVSNDKQERVAANIELFCWLQSQMPQWPWSWEGPPVTRRTLKY